jgi:hypothetical protein
VEVERVEAVVVNVDVCVLVGVENSKINSEAFKSITGVMGIEKLNA